MSELKGSLWPLRVAVSIAFYLIVAHSFCALEKVQTREEKGEYWSRPSPSFELAERKKADPDEKRFDWPFSIHWSRPSPSSCHCYSIRQSSPYLCQRARSKEGLLGCVTTTARISKPISFHVSESAKPNLNALSPFSWIEKDIPILWFRL